MEYGKLATDLKVWLVIAIILGLLLDPVTDKTSEIIIVVLMIQMILSMDGLVFRKDSFLKRKSNFLNAMMTCYVINTVITLIIGSLFINSNKEMWYGFAMMAAMPCAVAVITGTVLKDNDMNDAVAAVTMTYIVALALSPVISYVFIGDAVNPLEILKYIVLFILVPLIVTRFTPKLKMTKKVKVPIINFAMALIMFLCINKAQHAITNDLSVTGLAIVAVVARVVILDIATVLYLRRIAVSKENETTFHVMGVWKNTGLSVSMCMILLSSIPGAVIPGAISIMAENIWFSIITSKKYGCIPQNKAEKS